MTDNEIIKAVEHCHRLVCGCVGCPFDGETDCLRKAGEAILDLINRQEAEIERLHSEVKEKTETIVFLKDQATGWSIDFCNLKAKLNTAKTEAIKEFAEKVKDIVDEPALIRGRVIDTIIARIDNLAKEMTEERNGRIQ